MTNRRPLVGAVAAMIGFGYIAGARAGAEAPQHQMASMERCYGVALAGETTAIGSQARPRVCPRPLCALVFRIE